MRWLVGRRFRSRLSQTGRTQVFVFFHAPISPGTVCNALQTACSYGFIPTVSVTNLNEIPDDSSAKVSPADIRAAAIRAGEGAGSASLVAHIQNVGYVKVSSPRRTA